MWYGTYGSKVNAVICIIDLLKKDSEIKILIGCSEEEKHSQRQRVYERYYDTKRMKMSPGYPLWLNQR